MKTTEPNCLYFDFSEVFWNTKSYIDRYNKRQTQLTNKLNANHRATAELITRLYIKQLNQASRFQELGREQLPGFRTFNVSLATCKGCTKRTIINHKERLKQAGFIVREEHRGSEGIEIWITPEVLGHKKLCATSVDGVTKIGVVTSLFYDKAKNFHPLVHEQQEQRNNNITVHKSISGVSQKTHQDDKANTTGTIQEHDMNTGEIVPSVPQNQTKVSEKETEKVGAEHISFLKKQVLDFWRYTYSSLYPGLMFCKPEEQEILNHIWASVFQKFRLKGTKKQWENHQDMLYKRVDMVRRWLERNPNHWIPKPYLYFHHNNKRNGFGKTWEWYLKQETLKNEIRNQIIIQQTQHEWKQREKGEGRHKHKTRLQLFRIHEKRISNYKDKALEQAYQRSLQQTLKPHYVTR
ncbi:hypothetical protein J8281_03510 [Aquimarina sp. U1-2]|uniref:hypothetical protein n=1 Tax=Aquimarina sp. U1-2 TaxID=2823141 RepID=UPI001AED11CF|nr:hypothetical protein [Aquimarina sp. U1-2]MBP2831245.1 hypothetical protein [Aquimarina sp. U1-2]